MQKSNHQSNNNSNSRQSSSLSSSSISSSSTAPTTTSGGSGRRSYNRSHNNNFKFHNFVFNETNQKFCLEEQHGNKKITVMHWKKSDDPNQQEKSNSEFEQIRQVRNCDSDSKLIKSEKFRYIPDLLDRYRKESQDENISTEEEMIINDDDHYNPRLNTGVASSASFPLVTFRHKTIDDATTISDSKNKQKIDPTTTNPSISKLPPLPHQSETSSFSSGHSSASFLSPSLLESSSSSYNNFNRSDAKNSDDSLISKSYYSGSSIATTSSSSCSGINYSLDNLKLNENRYCSSGDFGSNSSGSGGIGNRRKHYHPVYNSSLAIEGDSEGEEDDDDSDFDAEDIFYQTYRQKIRQKIENLLDEVQSQPLDLSIKKDHNNNCSSNNNDINEDYKDNIDTSFTTKLDDDTISACESVDSLMSTRLSDSPTTPITAAPSLIHSNINRFGSYFDAPGSSNSTAISSSWVSLPEQLRQQQQRYQNDVLLEKMRTESLSPSELISSMKCCSPLSAPEETTETTKNEKSVPTSSSSNPFMFPHERTKMFKSFEPIINDQHYSHYRTPTPTTATAAEMFDALVEEEIQKFLQNSAAAASSSSSTSSCSSYNFNNKERYSRHQHHRRQSDLSKKIEDKLKLLQQEVLQNKLSESNFLNFISDPQNTTSTIDDSNNNSRIMDDDYLRMHFKFDSNKNLEPYFMDGYRTRLGSSSLASRFLNPIAGTSSSSNSSFGSSNSILAKNRRNQIKRHLEDSFKQNGFLVKTKQVSDANNSAMFCKFRQLRKYTRYYLKSWQNHLPDEVNKLWKGFLPPKSERPLFLTSASSPTASTSPTSLSSSSDDILASNAAIAASINSCTAAILAATAAVESIPSSSCLLAAIDEPSPSSSSSLNKVANSATTTLSTSSSSELMPPSSME